MLINLRHFLFYFLPTYFIYILPNVNLFVLSVLLSVLRTTNELPPHLEKVKQKANDAFARQQWSQAIELYSQAMQSAPRSAMLFGNRAAAYMKRKW